MGKAPAKKPGTRPMKGGTGTRPMKGGTNVRGSLVEKLKKTPTIRKK